MKRILVYLSLLAIVFAVPAFAENNTVINVHLDNAVAIPGNVLAPGNYVFRLEESGHRIVAISSADSKTFYGFIPVYTATRDSSNGTDIRATELDAAGLARIDSWFFPGEQNGYRFIYSNSDIAKTDAAVRRMQMKSKGNQSGF